MAGKTVYLLKSSQSPSQRGHFALYIPEDAFPGRGTLINVVGTPMTGFQLETKSDHDPGATQEPYESFSLGQVPEASVATMLQLAGTVRPPGISQNFMAPVDGVNNRRCQEWTTDFVKLLVDRQHLDESANQIIQAARDPPTWGIGLNPVVARGMTLQAPWTSDTALAPTLRLGDASSGLQAGVINGSVSAKNYHHHGPTRPESPPSPSALIPFGRDPHFINRRSILDLLDQKCSQRGSWTALVGLGGVGKSQLAIEYAYRICDHSPETWVFWVHASNAARFEQSFRDIANFARIPRRHDSQVPLFELVRDWLNQRQKRWLLILDNVDDASFLVEVQSGSAQGIHPTHIIQVNQMDKSDATALLQKKLENVQNRLEIRYPDSDIVELVTTLEFMPLAIVQAAAYISELAPRCTVRKYLEQFRQSEPERTSLLYYEGGQLRRDQEAGNSIIITWQTSFDYIHKTRRSAADLLSLMSFFDRQGIPESLLRRPSGEFEDTSGLIKHVNSEYGSDKEDSSPQCGQNEEFEKDVAVLRNFSFISVDSEGTTFETHSLVQLATRTWLTTNNQLERWKQQFIRNLHAEIPPTGDYEHWETEGDEILDEDFGARTRRYPQRHE
ncbi:hypothetical protein DV738_g2283, partial [Chaetothyriales sp. CBS 135597]